MKGDKTMNELKKLDNHQYAYLHQIPIGKLLELLDVAPVPASCPEDEAYVDALEEAIIEKENENPTGLFPDVDQQWEQFVTHYLPGAEDATLVLKGKIFCGKLWIPCLSKSKGEQKCPTESWLSQFSC